MYHDTERAIHNLDEMERTTEWHHNDVMFMRFVLAVEHIADELRYFNREGHLVVKVRNLP